MSNEVREYLKDVLGIGEVVAPVSENNEDSILNQDAESIASIFVIPLESTKGIKNMATKIAGATRLPIKVYELDMKSENSKDELIDFMLDHPTNSVIVFGEKCFTQLGFNEHYFFENMSSASKLNDVELYSSHDMMDLIEGPEKQVQNLKKQVWIQLKKVLDI